MTYRVELVPLARESEYTYSLSLEGRDFKFKFYLNSRTKIYHMELYSSADEEVLIGIPLLPLNTIASRYSLEEFGLSGYFLLVPFSEDQEFSKDVSQRLADHYGFFYLYEVV